MIEHSPPAFQAQDVETPHHPDPGPGPGPTPAADPVSDPAPDRTRTGPALDGPGVEPRWNHSAKNGIGTAYNTACRLWFTLSHGIVNELFSPRADTPSTRDLEFLVTDGETFSHEEKRDLDHVLEH